MSVTVIIPAADAYLNEIPTWEQAKLQAFANGNYTPPGAGGVARLINAKLAEQAASPADYYSVIDIDDTASINRAVAAVRTYGGVVFLTPRGTPYVTSDSIILPNAVGLVGSLARNFPGVDSSPAQWAAYGSWLKPTHSKSAVVLLGHGSFISGVGFVHDQPVPGVSFTPNVYGFCVECNANFAVIEDVVIVNASHGVWLNYYNSANPSLSGGGTGTRVRNLYISTFAVGFRTSYVNDILHIDNVHFRGLYYIDNAVLKAYVQANNVNFYWGYTDNALVTNVEHSFSGLANYFIDETCFGNTHSFYQGSIVNVDFATCRAAMQVAATTTHVVAQLAGVMSQSGHDFGVTWSDTMFQLGSDNVTLMFTGTRVPDAGGVLMNLGAGSGGSVVFNGLTVDQYSSVASGQPCLVANAGATIRLSNYRIKQPGGAGSRLSGADFEQITTDRYGGAIVYGSAQAKSLTGNGSFQDFSTDCLLRPGLMGAHEVRIVGTVDVTAAVASSTFSVRLSGLGTNIVQQTGLSSGSVATVSVDTGFVGVAEADLASYTIIGRLQINAAAGVTIKSESLQLQWR